jgi:hypothetical protein
VHAAQDQQHHANLGAEDFDCLLERLHRLLEFEGQAHVTNVDQVEYNHQQVVDRIRERLPASESVHQEDAAVFVKSPGDPDGQGDAQGQLNRVSQNDGIHGVPLVVFLLVLSLLKQQ